MELVGITMVKDEIDVIEYTLRHLVGQGVDHIWVADNMSTDGTRELLHELEDVLPVVVVHDDEVGYYQSRKMSALADTVRQDGADFIIPFDADECWYSDRGTLRETIRRNQQHDIHAALLFNHFPTSGDLPDENPFRRIVHRDHHPAPLQKVVIRAVEGAVIHQGNHGATVGAAQPRLTGMRVGHFPWRSFEQFVKKVRNGAAAYAATDLPEEVGSHWRSYGRILEVGGEEALHDDVWARWFCDPQEVDLVTDPVPFSG
jgi:hypothetical protein